jgi:hypothetical protein
MLGNRRSCYPLTITDFASRYLLTCEALLTTQEQFAAACGRPRRYSYQRRNLRSVPASTSRPCRPTPTTDRDKRPDRLNHAEWPCALKEPIRRPKAA